MSQDRKDAAIKLAENIRKFWLSLGFKVDIELVPITVRSGNQHHEGTEYGFRSNLVAGLPPGFDPNHNPYLTAKLRDFFL